MGGYYVCQNATLNKMASQRTVAGNNTICFRKHFKTKVFVIVDCCEVFICKPANLVARATTWSQYKHHNTVRFLIGISWQGVISFISKARGGRVSDKYLIENSGILDKLMLGDYIFADRGFDMQETVVML